MRAARWVSVVIGVALAVVVVTTIVEAALDYFNISLDVGLVAQNFVAQPGYLSVALVAIEEGGLPLPISGDILILYSAARAPRNPLAWLALALAFEVAVLIGSSLLFMVSRRYGARLLHSEVGKVLALTPSRLERAEGWLRRWGIWAVIFGRQIPGFRVAVTVVAASFGLSYRVFITGVVFAAAFWITLFMALGLVVGPQVEQLLSAHQSSSLVILGVVVAVAVIYFAGRVTWRRVRSAPS
jgi:membrane protein DedA with SNARE-associated domain